jgi:hypothetical protein
MDLQLFAEMVETMRERQKHYFKTKREDPKNWAHINAALNQSKALEKEVDEVVKNILHPDPQKSLF